MYATSHRTPRLPRSHPSPNCRTTVLTTHRSLIITPSRPTKRHSVGHDPACCILCAGTVSRRYPISRGKVASWLLVFARRGASRPLRLIYTPPSSRCGATSAFGAFLHTAEMTPQVAARFSPEADWGPLPFRAGILSALATAPSKYEFVWWGEGG